MVVGDGAMGNPGLEKPVKSLKISANVKLTAGMYFALIQIDPANALKDVDLTNNLIVSSAALTVA